MAAAVTSPTYQPSAEAGWLLCAPNIAGVLHILAVEGHLLRAFALAAATLADLLPAGGEAGLPPPPRGGWLVWEGEVWETPPRTERMAGLSILAGRGRWRPATAEDLERAALPVPAGRPSGKVARTTRPGATFPVCEPEPLPAP